jgi:hypothetical protein
MKITVYILLLLATQLTIFGHPRSYRSHTYQRGNWYNSYRHVQRKYGPMVRKQIVPNPNVIKLTEEFKNRHPVVKRQRSKQYPINKSAMLGQVGTLKPNPKIKPLTNEFNIQHRQTFRQAMEKYWSK